MILYFYDRFIVSGFKKFNILSVVLLRTIFFSISMNFDWNHDNGAGAWLLKAVTISNKIYMIMTFFTYVFLISQVI